MKQWCSNDLSAPQNLVHIVSYIIFNILITVNIVECYANKGHPDMCDTALTQESLIQSQTGLEYAIVFV